MDTALVTHDLEDHQLERQTVTFETDPSTCSPSELNVDEKIEHDAAAQAKHQMETTPSRKSLKRTMCSTPQTSKSPDAFSNLNGATLVMSPSEESSLNLIPDFNEQKSCSASSLSPVSRVRVNNLATSTNKGSNNKATKVKSDMANRSHLTSEEVCNDNSDNTSDPEDGNDKDASMGSELVIAAYNNFVRRLIDDTLDRSVTFCEQPRHAITALENMCSKAWPNLEAKRHRNRIRAYLKACRRNSKKNRGLINMKEPPTNGLSIEARHLVANALCLVAQELEELKKSLNIDDTNKSANLSSRADNKLEPTSTNLTSELSSQEDYQFSFEFSNLINQGSNGVFPNDSSEKFKIPKYAWNSIHSTSAQDYSHLNHGNPLSTVSNLSSNPNLTLPFLGFDPNYVASMLRFLPNPSPFQFMDSLNTNNSIPSSLQFPLGSLTKTDWTESVYNSTTCDRNGNSNGYLAGERHVYPVPQTNIKRPHDKGYPNEEHLAFHSKSYSSSKWHVQDDDVIHAPPPAHIGSANYSPIMNKAMSKLMDHCALSQDDLHFFRQNMEFTKEAIKHARGLSNLILRKVELLENHIGSSANGSNLTAMNLT